MQPDDAIEFHPVSPDNLDEVMEKFSPSQRSKVEAAAKKFAWIGKHVQEGNSTPDRLRGVMLSYFDSWTAKYGEATGPMMAHAAEARSVQLMREGKTSSPLRNMIWAAVWVIALYGLFKSCS